MNLRKIEYSMFEGMLLLYTTSDKLTLVHYIQSLISLSVNCSAMKIHKSLDL